MVVSAGRVVGLPGSGRLSGGRQAYETEPLAVPVTVHGCEKLRSEKSRTQLDFKRKKMPNIFSHPQKPIPPFHSPHGLTEFPALPFNPNSEVRGAVGGARLGCTRRWGSQRLHQIDAAQDPPAACAANDGGVGGASNFGFNRTRRLPRSSGA